MADPEKEYREEAEPGPDDSGEDTPYPRRPGTKPLSIVREIVLNMSVLMFAALVMIAFMINITHSYVTPEYAKYTPFFLIPYIVLFGLTVAVFGGRLISRLILKPLRELSEATRRVADGDLSTRVIVTENVEMEKLARSFNKMTDRLARGRRQLEQNLEQMRLLNEDLAQTQRELLSSEKLASVGRLAAGVAHEIGNPLSAIAGYLEIISRREYIEDADREMLGRVQAEVVRINEIIKELLDYSRPQDESLDTIDLNASVESTLTLMGTQKMCDQVEVEKRLGDLPPLEGNRSSIKQLIMNLVINAIQAMPGGGKLKVTTSPADLNGNRGMELLVEDTGPGIPPEILDRVFDPFFTTKEPGQGTGLGLSICQRIVENLNGKITIESSPGEGTSFNVWLPAAGGAGNEGRKPG